MISRAVINKEKLESQINAIPGLPISEAEKKKTIDKMKKAESLQKEGGSDTQNSQAQVHVPCDVCGKVMNKKSVSRHIRDLHPQRRPSVSSIVNNIDLKNDLKQKSESSLSPPPTEPVAKKDPNIHSGYLQRDPDGSSLDLKGKSECELGDN